MSNEAAKPSSSSSTSRAHGFLVWLLNCALGLLVGLLLTGILRLIQLNL